MAESHSSSFMVDREVGPKTSGNVENLLAQVTRLQTELDCLRNRYEELREAKDRAAERYKADYKKWKHFKLWLDGDLKRDDEVHQTLKPDELGAYKRASTLGKRKQFEMIGPDLNNISDEEKRREDSTVASGPRLRRHSDHDNLKEKEPSPSIKREKLHEGETESNQPDKGTSGDKVDKLEHCQTPPPDTGGRKRRGRYAQVPSAAMPAINSRFSIRKDQNQGLDYQYDTVVRNREERQRMLGDDCECCQDYYKAVGPVPVPQRPLWRSPQRKSGAYTRSCGEGNDKENTDDVEQHKQRISRHRHHWHRSKTPPAYWEIGFPDTQEASEINRRAAEMHRRKLIDVEVEAR
ncbi:hypothetical protein ID866_3863 [Astraeus odoratus]|nr:hypothetical protein ID866_3863 [Astraeus odoratus]